MKHMAIIFIGCWIMLFCACSSEKSPEPPQKLPSITLSPADKEKLLAFRNDILTTENLADKAIQLAGDELKNFIKGGEAAISLPAIIDKTRNECKITVEKLALKAIPDNLPPETKKLLNESKSELITAYKTYGEAFGSIKSFASDKNPMALLEYRKKYSQAQELVKRATEKLKMIMTSAGVS